MNKYFWVHRRVAAPLGEETTHIVERLIHLAYISADPGNLVANIFDGLGNTAKLVRFSVAHSAAVRQAGISAMRMPARAKALGEGGSPNTESAIMSASATLARLSWSNMASTVARRRTNSE